ncbi:MAG TPA: hypothetical protein VMV29_16800 [Ktedonobacterales bacterium]|nr:hypothetical protein [Ktedonobacterales bacterium]
MLQQNRMNTLRQTHHTITTVMPLVTAALAVTGAIIGSMERSGQRYERDEQTAQPTGRSAMDGFAGAACGADQSAPTYGAPYGAMLDDEREFSLLAYMQTLVTRVLLVALGFALVGALALIALRVGPVGVAIELTALILLTLYLAEKVTRRARRQARLVRQGRAVNRADRMRHATHATHAAQASQPTQAPHSSAHANATAQASQAPQPTAA